MAPSCVLTLRFSGAMGSGPSAATGGSALSDGLPIVVEPHDCTPARNWFSLSATALRLAARNFL